MNEVLEKYYPDLTVSEVDEAILHTTKQPHLYYYLIVGLLGLGIGIFAAIWLYQIFTGMGVTGLSIPVGWGTYIANFVFWVGLAHSGTLISAILYLMRAKFRSAVSRSAEAMTIIAIATAGLFPMIHLGRVWVMYYILPYPTRREIYPNFQSPLVWDLVAVLTYFTVSVIFFYVGLIPDLAAARDRSTALRGSENFRTRAYRFLALGWYGAGSQWRHYGRAYLYFAALATPLVISVHSVVSWDFAMGLPIGWHSTIFAPYFVAGAIHSGLAMVLLLMIPMRKILSLERVVTINHLDMVARVILVTTSVMGYSYLIEPFVSGLFGSDIHRQYLFWRGVGWVSPVYWSLFALNVIIPAMLAFRKVRRDLTLLFLIGLCVVAGMWLERFMIVTASLSHDYLPHTWTSYSPSLVEIGITLGSASFFLFWYLLFTKGLPVLPLTDIKIDLAEAKAPDLPPCPQRVLSAKGGQALILGVFSRSAELMEAVARLCARGYNRLETYTPMKLPELEKIMRIHPSPVRLWTLIGGLIGLASGYWLAAGTALINPKIVGGKHPVSWIPYTIIGFELLILIGSLASFIALYLHARLYRRRIPEGWDPSFSQDKYGLLISAAQEDAPEVRAILAEKVEKPQMEAAHAE